MTTIKFNLNNEVRRISFQKLPSYEEISETLKRLYAAKLNQKSFALQYVDTDGDLITVSSNEELEEAFRNLCAKPILRFNISVEEKKEDDEKFNPADLESLFRNLLGLSAPSRPCLPQRSQPRPCPLFAQRSVSPDEKVAHPAFCDHCNERIYGLRFKCSVCPDFDLCEKCLPEKDSRHNPGHLFFRIARPFPQFRCARNFAGLSPLKTQTVSNPEVAKTEEVKAEVATTEEVKTEVAKEVKAEVEEPKTEIKVELAPVEVKEEEKVPEKKELTPFESKLAQLEEMGFSDRERNIQVLAKRSGDIVRAIRDLLNQ